MSRFWAAVSFLLCVLAAPAQAQSDWSHSASGVSVPRAIGAMRLSRENDLSKGKGYDVVLSFGDKETPVTLYVYRPSYPNAALWFERTRLAMGKTVGSDSIAAVPRKFTLGNASAPNGLREELDAKANQYNFRATAVAIAHVGEWMVKARISSTTLDRAAVTARMDQLLAALRLTRPLPAPLPLMVPGPCPGEKWSTGSKIAQPSPQAVAAAAEQGAATYSQMRGHGGLAADPTAWCRDSGPIPSQYGTVYRRRDGGAWVTLLGDAGIAVAADRMNLPGGAGAALISSTTASAKVAALYDRLPAPDAGALEGIPVATGQAAGLKVVQPEP